MKKVFLKWSVLSIALLSLSITACNDDDKNIYETDYTENEVTQSKKDIEDAGIELVNQVETLKNGDAVSILNELIKLTNESDLDLSSFNVPVKVINSLNEDSKSLTDISDILNNTTEGDLDLSNKFETLCATYTYNFETEEFVKTENSETILFLFPGKSGENINTAEFKIYDFTAKQISLTDSDEEIVELPTGLKASLKYMSSDVITYELSAKYTSEGMPTEVQNELHIGSAYSFTQSLSQSKNKSANIKFNFKYGSDVLFAMGADANGSWSTDEILEADDDNIQEIVQNANAYCQIMTVKIAGKIDLKTIMNEDATFCAQYDEDDYSDATDKAMTDNLVSLIKDHAKLVVVYAKDNSKIASLEAYTLTETDTEYNDTTYDVDFRLIFSDNSTVSIETYFNDSLNNLMDSIKKLIDSENE